MSVKEDAILNKFQEVQTEEKAIDTTKKLRVGIIGTGGIANSHIKSYLNMPDVELVAGADIVPGRATEFFQAHGVENAVSFTDHREMLDKIPLDAVSVCTYNRAHAVCTIDALNKGIPVLLEKPMCVTMEEAVEICKAEKKSGKVLSIGFQPRFDENMKMIRKIVQSGALGKVYYIQTGGGRRRGIPARFDKTSFIEENTAGIGALADIGCYAIDMVLNAIDYPKPLTVSGFKSDYFGKDPTTYADREHPELIASLFGVDDFAGAFIRLEGGVILDFRIAWAMNVNTPGDTILLGTKGGLRIPSTDCWNGSTGGPMTIYHQVAGKSVETVIPLIKDSAPLFDKKVRSFLDAVKFNLPSPVPTSQIIYNQAIIDGIVKSHHAGKEVEISIPEF